MDNNRGEIKVDCHDLYFCSFGRVLASEVKRPIVESPSDVNILTVCFDQLIQQRGNRGDIRARPISGGW